MPENSYAGIWPFLEIHTLKFYLQLRHKLSIICQEAELLADSLMNEANTMNEIRKQSRLNQPSEHLFPLLQIKEKMKLLEKETRNSFPLFRLEHDIEHIYAMSACATTIESNVIHSVVSIPLINQNNKFTFIDPTLSESELDIIQHISKLSHQQIDHVLCAKDHQLKLLSTSRLQGCLRTNSGDIFFCQERKVTNLKHNSNRCSKLPESIIIQLHSHEILLKTKDDYMNITRGDIEKSVPLKGTYNIVEINPNCKIVTKDFKIEEIKDRETLEMHAKPFRVISFPKLEILSLHEFKELKESHNKLKDLTGKINSSQRKLSEDIKKNKQNNEINQTRVEEINENEETTYVKTWAFGGITIVLVFLGLTSFLLVICNRLKLNKVSSQ